MLFSSPYLARYSNNFRLSESKSFPKDGSRIYRWMLGSNRKGYGGGTNIEYTIQEWETILYYGFTHVYIFGADETFIADYGALFENKDNIINNTMYIVDKDDGNVLLKKVE